jgi:UDP-N-acetylmuramoyl-tripeptide--D-alanyl-D-alanine ligase
LGIGQLFTVGKMSAATAKAARDGGLNRVIEFENVEAAVTAIRKFLKTGDVVLLKASRASRLEKIAETLKSEKS